MGRRKLVRERRVEATGIAQETKWVKESGQAASAGRMPQEWYLAECKRGQTLLDGARVDQATEVFQAILARLGDAPTFERAVILGRLARCLYLCGRPEATIARLREAMAIAEKLGPTDGVKGLRGVLQSELGDALHATGQHGDARKAYAAALHVAEQLGNLRGQGVDLGHLGALSLAEGKLDEARTYYLAALSLFQQIHEIGMEAVVLYQLGKLFQEQRKSAEAERHYREAARLSEETGNLARAGQIWNALAMLHEEADQPMAANLCRRKAIETDRKSGDSIQLLRGLSKLAELHNSQLRQPVEARRLAEEALVLAKTLDPKTPEVWTIYGILGDIATTEAAVTVDSQRRAVLQAQAHDFHELRQRVPRIFDTLARVGAAPTFGRAVILGRLGCCFYMAGRPDLAVAHLREAIDITANLSPSDIVKGLCGTLHSELGGVLRATGQSDAARETYEVALEIAEVLQDIQGQAVHVDQLATLALAEGKLEEALARYRVVLSLARKLDAPDMEAAALHRLGTILQNERQWDMAERHYPESIRLIEPQRDPDRSIPASEQLTNLHQDSLSAVRSDSPRAAFSLGFEVTLKENLLIDYAFDTDLLVDGRRERRLRRWAEEPKLLADDARPVLMPCARNWTDDDGAVHFGHSLEEPIFERHPGCTVMRRTRREVVLTGSPGIFARLIRRMDGACTVAEILSQLPMAERAVASHMLAALAATGTLDVSGRPIGRLLHSATKKGVMPGGGLEGDDILRLTTDGNYREYPGARTIALGQSIPERLRSFHTLTRSRRSHRDYLGLPLTRDAFDSILYTACGVTGSMSWAGRKSNLRAYPSSGGLYAVEIYPVVFCVDGLEPAVYHYRPVENLLEVVRPIDRARIVEAMLPVEREMVAGAAAMICMTGFFPRHEWKYGEGGYRMLVAEVGHISQNLLLAATALGLSARPCGGVFDELLNKDLGLDVAQEQFMLSVLLGHTGGAVS